MALHTKPDCFEYDRKFYSAFAFIFVFDTVGYLLFFTINEEGTIGSVIDGLLKSVEGIEIIVVDTDSTDRTKEIEVNVRGGNDHAWLHSDEIFEYKHEKMFTPNHSYRIPVVLISFFLLAHLYGKCGSPVIPCFIVYPFPYYITE